MNANRTFRPARGVFAPGSTAQRSVLERAAPLSEVLAPGFRPTSRHDLHYFGGRLIPHMRVLNVYVGSTGWTERVRGTIDEALGVALADPGLEDVMSQYFDRGETTCTLLASAQLLVDTPEVCDRETLQRLIAALPEHVDLSGIDLDVTLFNFLLPPGVILEDDDSPGEAAEGQATQNPAMMEHDAVSSLDGLGGYHGSLHTTDGRSVYYAVCAWSDFDALGRPNGIPVFPDAWKNVVATSYHEICEARTDPDVEDAIRAGDDAEATRFLGWMSSQGEECGDFPVFEARDLRMLFIEVPVAAAIGSVPVQLQYSNRVHGPEGPDSV